MALGRGGAFPSVGVHVAFGALLDGLGREPCVTDGVTVTLLGDLHPGPGDSAPLNFVELQGRAFFAADLPVGAYNPWSAGLQPLDLVQEQPIDEPQLNRSSNSRHFVQAAGRGFFTAGFEFGSDESLFETDGTAGGTRQIEGPANAVRGIGMLDERLIYALDTQREGLELYITDGTPFGGQALGPIAPGGLDGVSLTFGGAQLGRRFYFAGRTFETGFELWRTDGSPGGTELYDELRPGPQGGFVTSLRPLVVDGRLFFQGFSELIGSTALWVTDGGLDGAVEVAPQFLSNQVLVGFAPLRD